MSVSGDDSPGRVEQAIILTSWLPGTCRSEAELTGGWGAGPDAPSSPRIHIPSLPPGSLVCPLTLLNYPQRWGNLAGATVRHQRRCISAVAARPLLPPLLPCPWQWLLVERTGKGALGCSQGGLDSDQTFRGPRQSPATVRRSRGWASISAVPRAAE